MQSVPTALVLVSVWTCHVLSNPIQLRAKENTVDWLLSYLVSYLDYLYCPFQVTFHLP